jgi:hypothetical protein
MLDRYNYVKCKKCGRHFQRIDWNCALHQITCGTQPQQDAMPILAPKGDTTTDTG